MVSHGVEPKLEALDGKAAAIAYKGLDSLCSHEWDDIRRKELEGCCTTLAETTVVIGKIAPSIVHGSLNIDEFITYLNRRRTYISPSEVKELSRFQNDLHRGNKLVQHLHDRSKVPRLALLKDMLLCLMDSCEDPCGQTPRADHWNLAQKLLNFAQGIDEYKQPDVRTAIGGITQSAQDADIEFDQCKAEELANRLGVTYSDTISSYEDVCIKWLDATQKHGCTLFKLVKALLLTRGLGILVSRICPPCRSNPPDVIEWFSNLRTEDLKKVAIYVGFAESKVHGVITKFQYEQKVISQIILRYLRIPNCVNIHNILNDLRIEALRRQRSEQDSDQKLKSEFFSDVKQKMPHQPVLDITLRKSSPQQQKIHPSPPTKKLHASGDEARLEKMETSLLLFHEKMDKLIGEIQLSRNHNCEPEVRSKNMEVWFSVHLGLNQPDIALLKDSGFGSVQGFKLIDREDVDALQFSRGGKKILREYLQERSQGALLGACRAVQDVGPLVDEGTYGNQIHEQISTLENAKTSTSHPTRLRTGTIGSSSEPEYRVVFRGSMSLKSAPTEPLVAIVHELQYSGYKQFSLHIKHNSTVLYKKKYSTKWSMDEISKIFSGCFSSIYCEHYKYRADRMDVIIYAFRNE